VNDDESFYFFLFGTSGYPWPSDTVQLQYPKSATPIPKTFRKVTADNFPQWCSLEQKLPSSVTHSPDRTRPGTPFLTSAIPGLRSALECRNLISSDSFAHRLGTGNSALRLAPGPLSLKPKLRQGRSEFIYKIWSWKNTRVTIILCLCSSMVVWVFKV